MSTSGKKGKKPKAQKVSLQEFLATTPSSGGTTQVVVQKVSSWAEECEDDDDHRPSRPEFIELPTAPRAARIFDDDSIPQTGPFSARVSNLPFDTNEQDVDEFFMDRDIRIKEMRLARDEQNDRLRGYGHIEFETRDDLVAAIMLPDAMIRNRRIRIELAGDNDQRDGRAMRKRYDNYTPRDPTSGDSTNWRERKESAFEPVERENRRGGYQQRSSFQNRHNDNDNNNNEDGGNWRMGDRPNDSPPPERRRNNYGDRGGDRRGGGGRYERRDAPEEERPVLNLQPRTIPLPVLTFPKEEELERPVRKVSSVNGDAENHNDSGLPDDDDKEEKAPPPPKPKPVPSVNIFGQAKPVDTAAREREIEEKLDLEREAKIQREKEEREKQREEAEKPQEAEVKKDVIVIRTEKSRQQEEAVNWRKHDEPSNEPAENRHRDNGRRFDGERRGDRRDDRPRQFGNKDNRDNRERNFNRGGDRDYRGGNMGQRSGDRPRDNNRRDGPRREFNTEIRREEPMKEPKRERVVKDFEERMPKYQAPAGPNLSVSNAFAGLDDEVDAD